MKHPGIKSYLLATLAAIGAVLFVFLANTPGANRTYPGPSAAITYLGRTNLVANPADAKSIAFTGEYALFVLQNRRQRRLFFVPARFEAQTPDGWVAIKAYSGPRAPVVPVQWPPNHQWLYFGGVLAPGEKRVFLVPSPTNGPWRIEFDFQEKAVGWKRMQEQAVNLWDRMRGGPGGETFSGPHFPITSPTVQP